MARDGLRGRAERILAASLSREGSAAKRLRDVVLQQTGAVSRPDPPGVAVPRNGLVQVNRPVHAPPIDLGGRLVPCAASDAA